MALALHNSRRCAIIKHRNWNQVVMRGQLFRAVEFKFTKRLSDVSRRNQDKDGGNNYNMQLLKWPTGNTLEQGQLTAISAPGQKGIIRPSTHSILPSILYIHICAMFTGHFEKSTGVWKCLLPMIRITMTFVSCRNLLIPQTMG